MIFRVFYEGELRRRLLAEVKSGNVKKQATAYREY